MNAFVIYSSIILLNLRDIFPPFDIRNDLLNTIVFIFFWIVIFRNYFELKTSNYNKIIDYRITCFFLIFLIITTIGYFRSYLYGLIPLSGVASANFRIYTIIILFHSILTNSNMSDRESYVEKGIFFALNFYIILVVILWFFGVQIVATSAYFKDMSECRMLSYLGIYVLRAHFPIASGVNAFGMLAGVAFVVNSILLFSHSLKNVEKWLAISGIFFCLFVMLRVDSRGALVYSLLTCFLVLYTPRKHLLKLSFVVFLIPIALIFIESIIYFLPYEFKEFLSRRSADQFAYSRLLMWENIKYFLSNFSAVHLIGYGKWGQVSSHVVDSYFVDLFENVVNDRNILSSNVHNFVLQQILDFGYIGMMFSVFFLFSLIRKLCGNFLRFGDKSCLPNIGILLFFVFLGYTEAVPTTVFPDIFVLFIFVCCAVSFAGIRYNKMASSQTKRRYSERMVRNTEK